MKQDGWLEILTRASVGRIAEIPPPGPSRQAGPARAKGGEKGGETGGERQQAPSPLPPLSPALWPMVDNEAVRFGVRIRKAPADPRLQAARLAAAAIERGAEPVILSHVPASGFEQAGFRVERIHGATQAEQELQEAELSCFWSLAIIVDLEEAAGMC